DHFGNVDTNYGNANSAGISIFSFVGATQGVLSNTNTKPFAAGLVSWDGSENLFLNLVGTYTLQATSGTNTGTSNGVTITPANATQFQFVGFPASVQAGNFITGQINALDPFGNVDTNYAGPVTMSEPSGHLLFTNASATVSGGVATFDNSNGLNFQLASNYVLSATGPGAGAVNPITKTNPIQVIAQS